MKHYFLGIQLFFFCSLCCMEQNCDNKISKGLLYEKYCSLKKEELVKIPDIKSDAMSLLDKELDDYYEQRLAGQSLPQSIEENKIEKYILMKLCPEFNPLFNVVQHHMIIDNVHNKQVIQGKAYSYEPEVGDAGVIKKFPSGYFKFMPTMHGLNADLFDGDSEQSGFVHKEELYALFAHAMTPTKTVYALTSSKIQNDHISNKSEMNVWTMNSNEFIKKIQHDKNIDTAIFSPDAQWIASNSFSGQQGTLMLTQLGDSTQDLSDIELISGSNAISTVCFNNASTVLAAGNAEQVNLFDLKTKKSIALLHAPELNIHCLELKFNHDDSRLIGCMRNGGGDRDTCLVMLWDTSKLIDIKELQRIEITTKNPNYAKINFKHDEKNIVAISTDNTTMFFDVHSGKFLSKTAELSTETDSYTHAGLVFMPCSSTVCVGMNTSSGQSSYARLYDYISGNCIGVIPYQQPAMDGIGITNNFRFLVTTFNRHMAVRTDLIGDKQRVAFSKIVQKLTLVEFYALLQLHKAKQQKCPFNLSQPLLQYMQESFFDDKDEGQKLIKKYFFS